MSYSSQEGQSSGQISSLVHSVRNLLAGSPDGAGSLPDRLVVSAAVPPRRNRRGLSSRVSVGVGISSRKGAASDMKTIFEEIKVAGHELVETVKKLIHQGNVTRIIIKNDQGHVFMEVPVTVAAIGVIFAPVLAAVAAIAAMAGKFTVVVEKSVEPEVTL
jgi:hypothetical protein